MTERIWLTVVELSSMLDFVRDKATERKLRLFVVGCARRVVHLCPTPVLRDALAAAERFADDVEAEAEVMTLARNRVTRQTRWNGFEEQGLANALVAESIRSEVCAAARYAHAIAQPRSHSTEREAAVQVEMLADVVGNPFRPVTFDPSWRTSTVDALAREMYESRDFSAMPILADALQEAGCEHADVLAHCRSTAAVHVRGCWVVDALLGKS